VCHSGVALSYNCMSGELHLRFLLLGAYISKWIIFHIQVQTDTRRLLALFDSRMSLEFPELAVAFSSMPSARSYVQVLLPQAVPSRSGSRGAWQVEALDVPKQKGKIWKKSNLKGGFKGKLKDKKGKAKTGAKTHNLSSVKDHQELLQQKAVEVEQESDMHPLDLVIYKKRRLEDKEHTGSTYSGFLRGNVKG
jgi:hypothetical protein